MNTQLLIDAVVHQTTVFIARLATAGGVRAPLASVANQVFVQLTQELQNQGVKKKVIADMFGMALRTYHRRVRELGSSQTDSGRTLWEAVLTFLREKEPVGFAAIQRRFRHDDRELLTGVLSDLVNSGLAYRSGRGDTAVYRVADAADFAADASEGRAESSEYLVWLTIYRNGPVSLEDIVRLSRLGADAVEHSIEQLLAAQRIRISASEGAKTSYESDEFFVPFSTTHGWEAAVLDHFQALVNAVCAKIALGSSGARNSDTTGGSTWTMDVWPGHPLHAEAVGTLARIREQLEGLRERVDAHNRQSGRKETLTRVVYYMGQYVQAPGDLEMEEA